MALYERTQCLIFVVLDGTLEDVRKGSISLEEIEYEIYALVPLSVKNRNSEIGKIFSYNDVEVISSDKEYTSLLSAVKNGKAEILEILLDQEGGFYRFSSHEPDALHVATYCDDEEIIEELLPINIIAHPSRKFGRLKFLSAFDEHNLTFLERLLSSGADIKLGHSNGGTLLHLAANRGQEILAQLLLRCGANVEARQCDGTTPLHIAALRGHVQMVEVLLTNGASVDAAAHDGMTALHVAAEHGLRPRRLEVAKILLQHGASVSAQVFDDDLYKGSTPLHFAVDGKNPDLVKLLLESGADVNAEGHQERNVLQNAVAFENFCPEVIEIILRHCPALENANNKKAFFATLLGHGEENRSVAEKMIQYGFAVSRDDADNLELLLAAIRHNFFDLVQKIISYGVDVNKLALCYGRLNTPSNVAAGYAELDLLTFILNQGADLGARCAWGRTPLIEATANGGLSNVKLLVKSGAKINDVDNNGCNALHYACGRESSDDIVKLLLINGANVNSKCTSEQTPIFEAVRRGRLSVVELLLNCGAYAHLKNKNGKTILNVAAAEKHLEILKTVLEHNFLDFDHLKEALICSENSAFEWYSYETTGSSKIGHCVARHLSKINAANDDCSELVEGQKLYCNNASMKDFLNECKHEVVRMKNLKVVDTSDVSFFEILKSNSNCMFCLLRSDDLAQTLNSGDYKSEFPIYASILSRQVQKGMLRKELVKQGIKLCRSLFTQFSDLPLELKEKILSYLSNQEIMILKTACFCTE